MDNQRANNLSTAGFKALSLFALVGLVAVVTWWFGVRSRTQPGGQAPPWDDPLRQAEPAQWTAITSTSSRKCLEVVANPFRATATQSGEQILLLYEGEVKAAYLVLTSCSVKSGQHHTIYVNGQPAAQVRDDSYRTCFCDGEGQRVAYALSDPSVVVSGWNYITITNDADVTDSWIAYDAQLVVQGNLIGAVKSDFTFTSSYDGSERGAAYKIPAGYSSSSPVPLLVSIGGTGEDRWDALYHYAERVNAMGWLLMAPEVRQLHRSWGGRTASLATQYDIMDAIRYMMDHFAVDEDRVYISGFSAGGGVAATVAAKYPHVFAAAVDWIGTVDFLALVQQRPDLYWGLLTYDFGCPPEADLSPAVPFAPLTTGSEANGADNGCYFEWQRRSAQSFVMNLKHVPLAIVHGRADEQVPFAQSEAFYNSMYEFYDPIAHNKVAVWHDGGHFDAVPAMRPLAFMSRFTRNVSPADVAIRTDESKDYYWLRIVQHAWKGKQVEGFSQVTASYDSQAGTITVTALDEREIEGGNVPLGVILNLQAMGLNTAATYTIEDRNLATGAVTSGTAVPEDGYLALSVARDLLGKVHRRYHIQPLP